MEKHDSRVFATREDAIRWVDDRGILTVPEGVTDITEDFAFFVSRPDLPHVRVLVIPASVRQIETLCGDADAGPYGFDDNPFCEIIVAKDNPRYKSVDGVLFTKDGKHLICYPRGRNLPEYTVPDGVETIVAGAFLEVTHLKRLYLPQSVRRIRAGAIVWCDNLELPDLIKVWRSGLFTIVTLRTDCIDGAPEGPFAFRFTRDEDRDLVATPVRDFIAVKAHPAGERRKQRVLRKLRNCDYFCYDKDLDTALEAVSAAFFLG